MPISLVDGDRLLDLLIEHDIGVIRRKVTVYELDEEAFSTDAETPEEEGEPAEPEATAAQRHDGRVRSLWPLPGGRQAWRASLDRMLHFVATAGPTMAEAVAWMIRDFPPVESEKFARGCWQVPRSYGLVETDGERLTLTTEGAAYLKDTSSRILLDAAEKNVLGVTEILKYLAEGPKTSEAILERMRTELGVSWKTGLQVEFRLGWLENMGIASADGDSWTLRGELPQPADGPPATSPKPAYTFDDHFAGKPPQVVALFSKLETEILALDKSVERFYRKQYVAYQIGKHTICSVIPQKRRLRLVLPLDPREVHHPLVRDISGLGHWGIGDLEVSYDAPDQLSQIMTWVRAAIDSARSASKEGAAH